MQRSMLSEWLGRLLFLTLQGWLVTITLNSAAFADDWPQWRGPDRDNISKEKHLLTVWPEGGPPLAWEFNDLGDGVVPVAVAGGRVFCTGNRDGHEYCHALNEADGHLLWSVDLGPAAQELALMRWLNQRTPTVDGDQLYVVMTSGQYVCLSCTNGEELWRVNALDRFHSQRHVFGYCDYPVIDGNWLIISPGGSNASVAALDKKTGDVVWTCYSPEAGGQSHCAGIVAEIAGERQFVVSLNTALMGVRIADGRVLWEHPIGKRVAVTHSPLAQGNTIFYASGYGVGPVLLDIVEDNGKLVPREVYSQKTPTFAPWLGSLTQVENHIFANTKLGISCLRRQIGEVLWENRLPGKYVYTVANYQLYFWTSGGKLGLAALDTQQYRELSHFEPFENLKSQYGITFPVVANGRLYVRDLERLKCFDVRVRRDARKQTPDAVFVPTPEEVVPRMLELADLRPEDLVVDLGSGDGRLLISASKSNGCRGIGIELEWGLVEESRRSAKESGVETLVQFQHGDLFEYDFSQANVLMLYILPEMLEKLKPKFSALRAGTRIVCHEFAIPGIQPAQFVEVESAEDGQRRNLYLYTVPLQVDRPTRSEAAVDDWPMFGGNAGRNAVVPDELGPAYWDAKSGQNVKWTAKLGSATYASPVVSGGQVYIGTNNGAGYLERYPASVDLGCLLCFREADGQFLWQYSAEKLANARVHDWPDQGLASSPLVEGNRLWLVSNRHVVVCLDTRGFRDGLNDGPVVDEPVIAAGEADVVWRLDMMKELGVFPHPPGMGPNTRCSIAASYRNLIYVVTGNGTDEGFAHLPAPNAPSLICLDRTNGKVIWTDASPGSNILDCQASHPLVADIGGRVQVIVGQGDGWIRSFDPLTGELIWKFDINRKESKWSLGGVAERNYFLGTPVLYNGMVYIGSGQQAERGEGPGRLVCIDPSKKGDISSELAVDRDGNQIPHRRLQAVNPANGEAAIANPNSGLIWDFMQRGEGDFEDTMHRTLSTVAVHDGLVIAPDLAGLVHCLDAATGKKYWSYDTFASIWASPLIVGSNVYVPDDEGDVAIFKLSPDPQIAMKKSAAGYDQPVEEIAHNASIFCSPIFANNTLYIASRNKLFAIADANTGPKTQTRDTSESRTSDPARMTRASREPGGVIKPVFSPTPQDIVETMLELANLERGDTVVDLGSGDGRVVITAAVKHKARAVGYEIDKDLVALSLDRARVAGVSASVDIKLHDMYTADLQGASVVTAYLYPSALNKLKSQFSRMNPGAKILTHHYPIPDVEPEQSVTVRSKETGSEHRIWIYTVPLKNSSRGANG